MGVTIHFEGQLKDETSLDAVMTLTRRFCEERSWPCESINEACVVLKRVRDERDWDYIGPSRGIVVLPHENSEPFRLEFDRDRYLEEYTKTQFAPVEVHIALVTLLRSLAPHFVSLDIVDEGAYYETGDQSALEAHINRCFELLDGYLAHPDKYRGPVRLPSGRIADVVSSE